MNRTAALVVPALVLALFAGCTSEEAPATTLILDFAGQRPAGDQTLEFEVDFEEDARPAAPFYAIHNATHPDYYSAFDQLETTLRSEGIQYEANFHPQSNDFFLASIDGQPTVDGWFWFLEVDGVGAAAGMGNTPVQEGQVVSWTLTQSEAGTAFDAPQDDRSLVSVDAPSEPGTKATMQVSGTVDPQATLTLTLIQGSTKQAVKADVDGSTWRATVQLPPGQSMLRVQADDGVRLEEVSVPLLRLVEATMVVLYSAYPVHANSEHVVAFDPSAMPTVADYEGRDVQHPDFATVHDFMHAWSEATGIEVQYDYFNGLGYSPSKFDGVGQPVSSAAPPYWCYKLNGESAGLGISLTPIAAGDIVTWEYGACA